MSSLRFSQRLGVSASKNIPGRAAYWLAFGSAVSILFSIAISQSLLALALAALLVSGERLRFPPLKLPLALFFVQTVLSLVLSGNPAHGLPQIRKFFVFAMLLVGFTLFRGAVRIRHLIFAWTLVASVSAAIGIAQFIHRSAVARAEKAENYVFYLDGRITGTASHWMTFGGEQMIVLLMLAAFLVFAPPSKWKLPGWVCLALLWVSTVLGFTRSVFLMGVPLGLLTLAWGRRRWVLLAIPAVGLAILAAGPQVAQRIVSAVRPHGEEDSNSRRWVMDRVGGQMIKAHPWFGLGPEQIAPQFDRYVPPDVPRPLPKGWYGHLHNIYLQYAAERGIPALAFLLWFIGKALFDFARALRRGIAPPEARFALHGAIAVIVAVLAEGLFEHNLGDSEVLTLFLTAIACGYAAIESPTYESQPAVLAQDNCATIYQCGSSRGPY